MLYVIKKVKRPPAIRQFVGIVFLVVLAVIGRPEGCGALTVGLILSLTGLAVRFWAGGHVKKDKELAVTGPYAYVRNPLYVGNVLIALGFCTLSGYVWSYVVLAVLYIWLYLPSIRKEERTLGKLFGQEFEQYRAGVRAMWPRLTPYRKSTSEVRWSAAQWVRNGEHIVNAGILLALLALILKAF